MIFVALARAESLDPSAGNGGLLGRLALSSLRPELRAALQGVKPGQVTPVVHISDRLRGLTGHRGGWRHHESKPRCPFGHRQREVCVGRGGLSEATASLQGFSKPPNWNQDFRMICGARNASLGATRIALEEARVAGAPNAARALEPPIIAMQVHIELGQLYSYAGEMAKTIDKSRPRILLPNQTCRRPCCSWRSSLESPICTRRNLTTVYMTAPETAASSRWCLAGRSRKRSIPSGRSTTS